MRSHRYREIRFILTEAQTHTYVSIETFDDAKAPETSWRYKLFEKHFTVLDIVRSFSDSMENADPVNWPVKNP
jgi:hypothetical protein